MIKHQQVAITLLLHAESKHTRNQMENKRKRVVVTFLNQKVSEYKSIYSIKRSIFIFYFIFFKFRLV